jgi:hypothetical protein
VSHVSIGRGWAANYASGWGQMEESQWFALNRN